MNDARTRTAAGQYGVLRRSTALPLLSLVSGLSLLLAACGPTSDTTTPVAVTPAVGATATGAPTAMSGTTVTTTGTAMVGGAGDATATSGGTSGGKKYSIGILQTSTHPALDFTREGIKQAFIQAGMVEGKTITFDVRNAELDAPTAAKMADAFIANKVDAIVTIGSPATAAALNETKKAASSIPIFFSAVADPYGPGFAGTKEGDTLTADPHLHPANMTGVQAFPPVEEGMKLIQEVKPGIKTVGLLWNPNEPNSAATTTEARRVAAKLGINLQDRSATKPADTLDAAGTLAQHGAEALFVSTTNSVVNGLDSVVRVAQENSVPLFGNDPLSASRGAVAAQGLDYTQNGLEAGQMAVQVLTGKATIKSLDVQRTTKESLCINTKAAELQKVTLPAALIARAKGCTYTEIKTPLPPAPAAGTVPPATPAPVGTPVPAVKVP